MNQLLIINKAHSGKTYLLSLIAQLPVFHSQFLLQSVNDLLVRCVFLQLLSLQLE